MTEHNVRVTVDRASPGFWTAFFLLGIIAVIVVYAKWILLFCLVAVVMFFALKVYLGNRAEKEALRQRAEEQDAWVYAGDPRGMFGHDWKDPFDEGPQRQPSAYRRGPVPKPGVSGECGAARRRVEPQ